MTMRLYDAGRGRVALSLRLAGQRDEGGGVWNQIAVEGQWKGHQVGEFQFTREVFETIIENFRRREDNLPLTYGHPDHVRASVDGAAGWIRDLRIGEADDGRVALFALMDFTDRAKGQIAADEQRHCSVVVQFDSVDGVTGEPIGPELHEVGLVLSAFISGMTPLAASDEGRAQNNGRVALENSRMTISELLASAGEQLSDDASLEDLIRYLQAQAEVMRVVEGEEPEADAMEAGAGDEDKVAAGADTASEGETVEAGDEPSAAAVALEDGMTPGGEPSPDGDAGSDQMALDMLAALAEELGVDMPALLAMIDENKDALFGTPADGQASDDTAAMGRFTDSLRSKLDDVTVQCGRLANERDGLKEQNARLSFEMNVQRAITAGKLTDQLGSDILDLHKEAPAFAQKRLDAAVSNDKGVVPLGDVRNAARPDESGEAPAKVALSQKERIAAARKDIRAEKPSATRREVHSLAYKRVRAEMAAEAQAE